MNAYDKIKAYDSFAEMRKKAENPSYDEPMPEARLASLDSGWISVKDRLPLGYCIAFRPKAHSGTQVATVFYDWKMKRWGGNFEVTHWMPLPDAPPEKQK